jgi:hypothetical protein
MYVCLYVCLYVYYNNILHCNMHTVLELVLAPQDLSQNALPHDHIPGGRHVGSPGLSVPAIKYSDRPVFTARHLGRPIQRGVTQQTPVCVRAHAREVSRSRRRRPCLCVCMCVCEGSRCRHRRPCVCVCVCTDAPTRQCRLCQKPRRLPPGLLDP